MKTREEILKRLKQIETELKDEEYRDRGWDSTKVYSLQGEKYALEEDLKKLDEMTKEGDQA